jgi:hypothetical protein
MNPPYSGEGERWVESPACHGKPLVMHGRFINCHRSCKAGERNRKAKYFSEMIREVKADNPNL